MKKAILSSGKDQSLLRKHPWVFSGAIKKIKNEEGKEVDALDGEFVEVFDNKDNYLATGYYQNNSIAIRILSFTKTEIGQDFWNNKIEAAFKNRTDLNLTNNPNTNVYRLVHAEGDGIPGLIVDYYNGTAVMQCHSIGIFLNRETISKALQHVLQKKLQCVYNKSEDTLAKPIVEKFNVKNEILWGNPTTQEVLEYNHKFNINWETGQKTGFFIDQRENRQLLAQYSKGKTVLNTFCYSGGFSVYALQAGATLVHSVDSSAKAIELVNQNILLNFGNTDKHSSFVSDTFDFFENVNQKYDIIILDPPAFAKHQDAKHRAVQGYKRLNSEALKYLNPGGMLFTYSCSQAVDKYLFNSTILSASIIAARKIKVIHQMHQPADHAYSIYHPEGEYLKGLVLQVD